MECGAFLVQSRMEAVEGSGFKDVKGHTRWVGGWSGIINRYLDFPQGINLVSVRGAS